MSPRLPDSLTFPNTRRGNLTITVMLFVFVFGASTLVAQDLPQGNHFPFPGGLPGNVEQMFESMFGPASLEEEQALSEIKISYTDERRFGQKILDAYLADLKLRKLRVVRKGPDVEYLHSLVETIHPFMTNAKRYKQITVLVVESDDVDARSIPGGTLVFYKGLLEFARSEAALIGIVGHELSHLDREHLLLPLKRTKILEKRAFVPSGSFDPRKFAESGTMMMRLMGRPFRPEDESAADKDGAEWAYRAGYDSRELADLFARLHLKNKDAKVPFGNFFRTHPYNEDRSAVITAKYEELQENDPTSTKLYIGKQNLKTRVPKSVQVFSD